MTKVQTDTRNMLIAAISGLAMSLSASPAFSQSVRVVDGDTLLVDGITYRLEGIDAPEAGQTCQKSGGGTWACGKKAVAALVDLVEGKRVVCDNRGIGEYGRTLAICQADGSELNEKMVRQGLAWAYLNRHKDYSSIEKAARVSGLGIWQAGTLDAESFRYKTWDTAKLNAPSNCPIKGKMTEGVQIYHTPWSAAYESAEIIEENGDKWLCSEAQAMRAGWTAPIWGN